MARGWRRWHNRELRFPKYQELVYGERYYLDDYHGTNFYFRFRQGSVPNIRKPKASRSCRWRSQSMSEKRQWFDYEQQMLENGFTPRRRRVSSSLITTYDDWPKNDYRGSWKHSTKKRRQWGGNSEIIYCG